MGCTQSTVINDGEQPVNTTVTEVAANASHADQSGVAIAQPEEIVTEPASLQPERTDSIESKNTDNIKEISHAEDILQEDVSANTESIADKIQSSNDKPAEMAPLFTSEGITFSPTGVAFYNFHCAKSQGDDVRICMRYTEFKTLHIEMAKIMANEANVPASQTDKFQTYPALPSFPQSSIGSSFFRKDKQLLEQREAQFLKIINAIVRHPIAAQSTAFQASTTRLLIEGGWLTVVSLGGKVANFGGGSASEAGDMENAGRNHHEDENEMLSLTLRECVEGVPSRETTATTTNTTDEAAVESFTTSSSSSAATASATANGNGEASALLLTLPGSPTLLPLTTSPTPSQQPQYAQKQAPHHNGLGNLNMLGGSVTMGENHAVHGYFQNDHEGEFSELQKNDDYRRLTDAITAKFDADRALELSTVTTTNTKPPPSKKRKSGANVSIDLQTKIRLIELAEEYQYDPKSSGRGKQDGSASMNAKEQMSGIRLAAQFGLNKSTVSRILKRKEEFKKAYYKDNISGCSKHINKKSKFEKLNRLVENWFDVTREKKVAVSDTLIRDVGKRFAEELGIDDFRGSNGWVRSLRNRKEHQVRNMSMEAIEREKMKKDAEAIERMRMIFPNGMKDMAGFFKDLSTFLEKDGSLVGHGSTTSIHNGHNGTPGSETSSYVALDEDAKEDERMAEEFLKKKMIENLRAWSHELMESDLTRLKKKLKPRQTAML